MNNLLKYTSAKYTEHSLYWDAFKNKDDFFLNLPKGSEMNDFSDEKCELSNKNRSKNSLENYVRLISVFSVILRNYSSSDEILFNSFPLKATPSFKKTVPLVSIDVCAEKQFSEVFCQVKESLKNGFSFQDYPLPKTDSFPSSNVYFALEGLTVSGIDLRDDDLLFLLQDNDQEYSVTCVFNSQRFELLSIRSLLKQCVTISANLNDDAQIKDIALVSDEEFDLLLHDFNATEADYPVGETVISLFESQLVLKPDNTALLFEGKCLTYAEFSAKVNQLTSILIKQGVSEGQIVGILSDRSFEMMVGIYAILKSGAAYLPMNPEYPLDRLSYMLQDCGARLVLTVPKHRDKLPVGIECIDLLPEGEACSLSESVEDRSKPEALAYVIYTSGSTGNPKGVMIKHTSVVNRINWMQRSYPIGWDDTIIQKTTIMFDVSVWELFWWSQQGASLCLLTQGGEKDPVSLCQTIENSGVTVMHFVPSMLQAFLSHIGAFDSFASLQSLKYVFSSGEALLPSQVNSFNHLLLRVNNTKLINLYGPTEATVDVSYYNCFEKMEYASIPIGKPIENTYLYILDSAQKLLPVGMPGELCIGGVCLSPGYINNERLTNEKFIDNPYKQGELIYRTGDLARWLPDGNIEYLGRLDHQVKVRGFRIELGEIEAQLCSHPQVKESVVLVKEKDGENFLAAYYTAEDSKALEDLRSHLLNKLPDYMIPSYIVHLNEMPLTSNGKLDRKQLPEPYAISRENYIAPSNDVEKTIAQIWSEVLGVEKVGINDNYLVLGGDSIKSIRIVSLINKAFETDLKVADIFQYPQVQTLALYCRSKEVDVESGKTREAVCNEIKNLKSELLSFISDEELDLIADAYPMSDIERGMVYYNMMSGNKNTYHDQFVYQVKWENFDLHLLQRAITLIVKKHDNLRTSYKVGVGEQFFRLVYKQANIDVPFEDISAFTQEQKKRHLNDYLKSERTNAFEVDQPSLWRFKIFNLGDSWHCIIFQFHHAILDGWSVASLMNELYEVYDNLKKNSNYQPPLLSLSYKDYVVQELIGKKDESVHKFWQEYLNGFNRLDIFSDKPKRQVLGSAIPDKLFQDLKEMSNSLYIPLRTICFSAYLYCMKMLSYDDDFVVGVVSHNRPVHPEGDKLLGCFLNTVPFRYVGSKDISWEEFLLEIHNTLLKLKEKETLSLFEIAQFDENSSVQNPFFDTLFNFVDFYNTNKLSMQMSYRSEDGISLKLDDFEETNTFLDFTIQVNDSALNVNITNTREFVSTVPLESLLGYYQSVLEQLVYNKTDILSSQNIFNQEEQNLLLNKFNATKADFPSQKTITELFEEQVARTPEHIAVASENRSLTYRELNDKSNQLARRLLIEKISNESIIGVMMSRDVEMIISIFAILKAGCAYLPIDPDFPAGRINAMIESSKPSLFLSDSSCEAIYNGFKDIAVIDVNEKAIYEQNKENISVAFPPSNMAYLIFTSGSTGRPKGIMIEHRNVINFIEGVSRTIHFGEESTILCLTTISFDIFVLESLLPLLKGSKVVMAGSAYQQNPDALASLIRNEAVNMLQLTPSRLKMFLNSATEDFFDQIGSVMIGGEALPDDLLFKLQEKFTGKIYNMYGPTETTVWSTIQDVTNARSVDIGKPILNTYIYIIDKNGQIQPIGVPGELCIAGEGLARGYWKNDNLTNEKFVEAPFHLKERMYKTGDLARWLPEGSIEFIGRLDHQVKIRGYRIELEEIETSLQLYPEVKEAVVVVGENETEKTLIAYYVSEKKLRVEELRKFLSVQLPDYMLPSYFINLETMPLTPNGKLNRKALPSPEINIGDNYLAPSNEVEEKIVEIWAETLKINKDLISVDKSFFVLGGDSMKAINILAKINNAFSVTIEMGTFYNNPKVSQLAEICHIDENSAESALERSEIEANLQAIKDRFLSNLQ